MVSTLLQRSQLGSSRILDLNALLFVYFIVKGSVQRKLRWVETGVNQWVWASDRGAGQYFIIKVSLHLVLSLFPFPVSTTQFIDDFWNNR
jgi:hypothetical protein